MKRTVRTTGMALGLAALLLLAACTAALPTDKAPAAPSPAPDGVVEADPPTTTPTETPARAPTAEPAPGEAYDIVTLLPPDAIPSIDDPEFYAVRDADEEYQPGELVLGVAFEGDARAYALGVLSRHEIVNDTVGGRPIAVTW